MFKRPIRWSLIRWLSTQTCDYIACLQLLRGARLVVAMAGSSIINAAFLLLVSHITDLAIAAGGKAALTWRPVSSRLLPYSMPASTPMKTASL
jgi:hypothetical protein